MKWIMKLALAVLIITVPGNLYAQKQGQAKIDSLLQELPKQKEDTNKVNLLNNLSNTYSNNNTDEGIKYGQVSVALAEKLNWKKGIANANLNISTNFLYKSDYPKSLEYGLKAIKTDEEIGYKKGIAAAKCNIGNVYLYQGDYPKALEYDLIALKIDEEIGNKEGIATVSGVLGMVCDAQNDYPRALEYYFKALKIAEEIGNKGKIAATIGNIGLIYKYQDDYPKALEYFFKSLKMLEEVGNKKGIAAVTGNIGDIYMEQGDYPNALEYDFRSLKILEEIGDKYNAANGTIEIGRVYLRQLDYSKALEYDFKSLKISEEIGDKNGIAFVTGSIGAVYLALKTDTATKVWTNTKLLPAAFPGYATPQSKADCLPKAIEYLERGLKLSNEINLLNLASSSIYEHLAEAYELNGDYKKALEAYRNYTKIKDSIFSKENNKKIIQQGMKYEYEKKEAVTKVLSEKELQKQKLIRNGFVGGFAVVFIFAGVFFSQRNKIKKGKKRSDELLLNETKLNNTITKLVNEQEETIKQRTQQLAHANKKLVELIQYNAHNLREPLARVMGAMNIQEYMTNEEFYSEIWPGMRKAVTDLDNSIKDVITIADETVNMYG